MKTILEVTLQLFKCDGLNDIRYIFYIGEDPNNMSSHLKSNHLVTLLTNVIIVCWLKLFYRNLNMKHIKKVYDMIIYDYLKNIWSNAWNWFRLVFKSNLSYFLSTFSSFFVSEKSYLMSSLAMSVCPSVLCRNNFGTRFWQICLAD